MSEIKRSPVINTHCHLLNKDFVPDRMTKLLSKIPERYATKKTVRYGAGILFALVPGNSMDRIKKYLENFGSDIDTVTANYVKALDAAKIDICVPLMMDLEQAAPVKHKDTNIPFHHNTKLCQIDLISAQVARYPWRLFPFIMFDPRRHGSANICITAIEQKGFIGIKMYPPLGYHPSPKEMAKRNKSAARELETLYAYCSKHRIPITTHASTGGAYSTKMNKNREVDAWPLTEVSNWLEVLIQYPGLKLNFAHMGGNYMNDEAPNKRAMSSAWRREIMNLISRSHADDTMGTAFADLSYHDMALGKRSVKKRYFQDLRAVMADTDVSGGILFGTDASMISHTWSERQYIKPFRDAKNLPAGQKAIFTANPKAFLFNNTRIPKQYVDFLRSEADAFAALPPWVERRGNGYFMV